MSTAATEQPLLRAVNQHNLRGHSMKLYLQRSSKRIRQSFFSQRGVIKRLEFLPQEVVHAKVSNYTLRFFVQIFVIVYCAPRSRSRPRVFQSY
jgi:ABC-type polysaccharide/polyol phosphate export permease